MTSRMLSNGHEARLERDAHGLSLVIDGIMQSHIGDPEAPPQHASARWVLAAALEALAGGGSTALHLGGGAVTLPRLLQHALPRLRQRVVELEPALVELVLEAAPLPPGIELIVGDGRAVLERVDEPVALVTTDVFGGGRVPAAFTSVEFYRAASAALQPGGMLVANSVDGPPLHFVRQQLATVRAAFAHVGLLATGSTLAGARFSNVILLASDAPLPMESIRERLRGKRPPVAALDWRRLERFVADTAPAIVTDATAVGSPALVRAAYLDPAGGVASLPPSLTEPIDD
ncbi:fused MFS/spermidine synthase [Agrococcus sp. ARC_14]|uniref:spermidine synthase n=1 Tax=Agrococcus sp. ARC_14 TaxID=2919927 RepID=UPI001F054A02|nr:fused MFS/spermidine synthase [Agrococcus sp. ARC_14]MCH1884117.1 fused MFS/spermidine synthase [Agrococcus sp. ARC_14]